MMTAQATRRPLYWLIVVLTVAALATVWRLAINVTHGLRAEYFAGDHQPGTPAGRPTLTVVDPEISTEQVTADWLDPPPTFPTPWVGFVIVGPAGAYPFPPAS